MTTLTDALRAAAAYLRLNAEELVQFAEQTPTFEHMPYGGFSIDREEGMFLYALVRALEPETALEIGVFAGVSSQHILAGMDGGQLVSVDVNPLGRGTADPNWSFIAADATSTDLPAADFVYEDSDHQMPAAATILGKVKALSPRVVVSHDMYSDVLYQDPVGFQVRQAFEGTFGKENVIGIKWDRGQRGFGLWLNPDWQAPAAEKAEPTPAPRKRAPAKKAPRKR